MGEALLRERAGDYFEVYSAGTRPKDKVFPPVVEVLNEVGIDMSDRKPKALETLLGKVHFHTVIVVCGDADKECPGTFGSEERLFWPFDDPAAVTGLEADILGVCRRVRDEIDSRIRRWLKEQGIPPQGAG
jgi:arsenate reductase